MSVSNTVRMAAAKVGMNQAVLAKAWGISAQAEITGGKLALIYPDGQQLLFLPEEKAEAEQDG